MSNILRFFILILCLGGYFPSSIAQERHWDDLPGFTIGDGLSNNFVTVVFQDSYGFLWIGTADGLNRYDGYEFKTFRHNPSDEHSISGNHIQAIVQDNQNNLWVGTRNNGLSMLDYSTGKFSSFLADEFPGSLAENSIYGLLVDKEGSLWVKSQTYLSLVKGNPPYFENHGHFNNVFNVKEAYKYPVCFESDTTILVGTKDGLNRFNLETKHFSRINCETMEDFSCQDAVFDILPYGQDKYLIGTTSGLYLLSVNDTEYTVAHPSGIIGSGRAPVNDILELESGDILVGTHRGLNVFDRTTGEHSEYLHNGELLPPYHVTSLVEDKSGIVWVGTRYNGLLKLFPGPQKFNSVSAQDSEIADFKSFNFQTVFQDNEGFLWLGTIDSGIYKYHPYSHEFKHYIVDEERFKSGRDAVYVLYMDNSGTLWAGTASGLYSYSPVNDGFFEYEHQMDYGVKNLLKSNQIYTLKNDFEGNLWIGTRFGLYRYDGMNLFSYFHDKHDTTGLYSDQINVLCPDEEGNLYIGTTGGLNVWDRESRQIRRLYFDGMNPAIMRTSVLSLNLSHNGNMQIGTRSGVWEMASKESKPVLLPGNAKLDNDMINSVVSDETNRVWVSTNKGLACFNPDGTVFNYDIVDGLPGYVFNKNSMFMNREGSLFFGSTEGLCWFNPDSISYNLSLPPLSFTKIRVTKRGQRTESYWPLRETLKIKYRPFNSVDFEFSALEFTQPSKNRYKVFLEGYDDDWQEDTYNNNVSFSNLLPGEYTLKVIASNNDFTWNNKPLELQIIVNPPLWMSNYAFAFYLLTVIFVIHLFINYRVRHYRKANKELQEKTVNKKQIEAQREVLTRINRSLTDSINYARRIQRAMIPSESSFSQLFPNSFVYLRARDIVSGDFFWYHEKDDKIFVAAVDCTGHGVPGAFMSIIGIDMLKNIVEVQGLESPEEILKTMNGELIRTLHREQPSMVDGNINDGMDMSLIVIDRRRQQLEFAGAYNGFYLIRDNEIFSYKGNRFPVGYLKDGESPVFTSQEVSLQKDDVIYLFSDGLPDQFGGPNHQKFKYRRFRLLLLNIHKMSFPDQRNILHQKIEEWMNGNNEQIDDMLVIGIKPFD